ncbi:hypothetical protein GGI11_009289 [Coemansia sp. RSA 2049]|nr:hypothetical protein GGI11_009289 [Coemansia sp. RSA 2049]KAJ2515080.1 hypothetical protein H4217_005401 [Coemansia sp. RSA 1939]KAJ2610904.1 hypothetical protein EV177_003745 [Coemansia sp. RSA 1804]KAJ2692097.1 hypothetical protein GGH99_001951 [Coemansia sp. RSA 1285]
MKFALAIAAVAATAAAADVNTMDQISSHWSDITSIINGDLPALSLVNPSLYAQATSVIGGTAITQDFNSDLVQHVATGISPDIMNPVLSRAGVTGVTLDGSPIPTGDASSPTSAESSASPTTAADESTAAESSAADESSAAGESTAAEESTAADESSVDEVSGSAEDSEEESGSADESSEEDESSDAEETTDSHTSGAAKAVLGSAAAALAAVAALF